MGVWCGGGAQFWVLINMKSKNFIRQLLIMIICGIVILLRILYYNYTIEPARIIETNLLTTVEVYGKEVIKVTGVDTFGVTSNPGSTINKLKINARTEINSLAVSSSQIIYSTVKGDVYEVGLKKTPRGCIQNSIPKRVQGIDNIVKVVAGNLHFLAIDTDGKVYGWGSNIYGESYPGSTDDYIYKPIEIIELSNASDIVAGYSTSGCIKHGKLFLFGEDNCDVFKNKGINVLPVDNAMQVSIGRHHIIVKNKNNLFGCGYSFNGELGIKKDHIDCTEIFKDKDMDEIVDIYCGSYYSALLTKDAIDVFGGLKGTPLYSLNGSFQAENLNGLPAGYIFSNYDIRDRHNYSSINPFQKYGSINCECVIIDSGVLYKQNDLAGVNYQDGSDCINKRTNSNLHGECVFDIIKSNCKVGNEDIFILKTIDGESGNSIDILEALYFIKHNTVRYVNMSIAFNNKLLEYVLYGLISNEVKYCFSLNNYENTDSLYIDRDNIYYVYDSNQMDKTYIKSLQCKCIGMDMGNIENVNKLPDMRGNSFATAKYTNLCLRRDVHSTGSFMRGITLKL